MQFKLYSGGKAIEGPTWDDIQHILNSLRVADGYLCLNLIPQPLHEGPEGLDVWSSEEGHFLMTLGMAERSPRVYINPDAEDTPVDVLGDMWSARLLTKDFDLVTRAVKEFFETGDVSYDILK